MNSHQPDSARPGSGRFLEGRVQHVRLPVYREPTGPDVPVLKRLLLPQGELAQFYDGEQPIHYIAFIDLLPGGIRGNHVHRRKKEFIYLIEGELDLLAEDVEHGPESRVTVRICAGEMAIVEPGIAHALVTIQPGRAIEFSPARFDATDSFRHPLAPANSGPTPQSNPTAR